MIHQDILFSDMDYPIRSVTNFLLLKNKIKRIENLRNRINVYVCIYQQVVDQQMTQLLRKSKEFHTQQLNYALQEIQ